MNKLIFPGNPSRYLKNKSRGLYYRTHYQYVKNILEYGGCNTTILDNETTGYTDKKHINHFTLWFNDKPILLDYSDHLALVNEETRKDKAYFKFHTTNELEDNLVYAFPPISFYDWNAFEELKNKIKYNPLTATKLFYKTNSYGAAIERRNDVRTKLTCSEYVSKLDTEIVPQQTYWESFSDCLLNVVVPGARNDMIDRTHMQSFAFGIPVVTPKLTTKLPYNIDMIPNIDYIECADDYSNLLDVIDNSLANPDFLMYISQNSKRKFNNYCTPKVIQDWVTLNCN